MSADLVGRLRRAGCVFAEQEASALLRAEPDPARREALVRRREEGEPLEHVVGVVRFGRLPLAVGPGVFVPRQRSLQLARLVVRRARVQAAPVLVELCAGVAPLACAALQALPDLEAHAGELDPAAADYARRNLPASAPVHEGSLLDALPSALGGRVTLLAAVPPYVPTGAARLLTREARDHEPPSALYGGPDGLDVVRRLLDGARDVLAPGGRVLLELSASQGDAAVAHARGAGLPRARTHGDGQTVVLELAAA